MCLMNSQKLPMPQTFTSLLNFHDPSSSGPNWSVYPYFSLCCHLLLLPCWGSFTHSPITFVLVPIFTCLPPVLLTEMASLSLSFKGSWLGTQQWHFFQLETGSCQRMMAIPLLASSKKCSLALYAPSVSERCWQVNPTTSMMWKSQRAVSKIFQRLQKKRSFIEHHSCNTHFGWVDVEKEQGGS